MNKFNNKNRLEGREREKTVRTVCVSSALQIASSSLSTASTANFLRFTSLHGVYASYLVLRMQKEVEEREREHCKTRQNKRTRKQYAAET